MIRSLVPRKVALKSYERMLDQGGGAQEDFLDLIDLREIIDRLWSDVTEFRQLEAFVRPRNRQERSSWLSRLNEIREVVAHPTPGDLTDDMRRELREIENIVVGWLKC